MRYIICLVSLFIWLFPAQSQVFLKAGFGLTNSNLQKESELGKKYAEGRAWNMQLEIFKKVEENVYFQTGIRKSSYAGIRNGYQPIPHGLYKNLVPANFGLLYGDVKEVLRADYLEVPVLIRFVGGKKLQYYVNMGPSLNWTIDAMRKAKGNTRLYYDELLQTQVKGFGTNDENFLFNVDGKEKVRKEMQNFMLGFRGGWGFAYPLASGLICIENSLFVGYMPMELQEGWDGRHVPSSWDINVGYIINLKK